MNQKWQNQTKTKRKKNYCQIGNHSDFKRKFSIHWKYQVAAWVPDMLSNFYLVKNNKTAHNSATTENKHRFGMLKVLEIFWTVFDLI
jgi:hypothetical protein